MYFTYVRHNIIQEDKHEYSLIKYFHGNKVYSLINKSLKYI